MFRSSPEQSQKGHPSSTGGLQARILAPLERRQRESAKGNNVWVEILDNRVSVGGYRLEAVLASVEERLGVDARILHTERQIVGGIKGFFGRECFVVEAALPTVDLPGPATSAEAVAQAEPVAQAGPATYGGRSFADALAAALDEVGRAESLLDSECVEPAAGPAGLQEAVDPTPAPVRGAPELRTDAEFLALRAADLPYESLATQVAEMMKRLTPMPNAGIVAIVGDPEECVVAARSLALRQGIDPGEVTVVSPKPLTGFPSWMSVTSVEDCRRRRTRWASDKRLHIVAVVLNAGPTGMNWARASLDALSPDLTHLAVPGWRRAEEVVGRLRSLAPIAAIDLVGAVDPCTVVGFLDLNVAVATIDGDPVTVERWCSYISPTAGAATSLIHLPRVPTTRLEQVLLDQFMAASSGREKLR